MRGQRGYLLVVVAEWRFSRLPSLSARRQVEVSAWTASWSSATEGVDFFCGNKAVYFIVIVDDVFDLYG